MAKLIISNKTLNVLRKIVSRFEDFTFDTQRSIATGNDPYGQPNEEIFENYLIAQPCFYQDLAGNGENETNTINYRQGRYSLLVDRDLDIVITDRVTNILDRDGLPVDVSISSYEVKQVIKTETHKEVMLDSIS